MKGLLGFVIGKSIIGMSGWRGVRIAAGYCMIMGITDIGMNGWGSGLKWLIPFYACHIFVMWFQGEENRLRERAGSPRV